MPDLKPKTMVSLMYSSGLRIGEVCRFRYEDVDRKKCGFTLHTLKTEMRDKFKGKYLSLFDSMY